jgi:hypothetical protein
MFNASAALAILIFRVKENKQIHFLVKMDTFRCNSFFWSMYSGRQGIRCDLVLKSHAWREIKLNDPSPSFTSSSKWRVMPHFAWHKSQIELGILKPQQVYVLEIAQLDWFTSWHLEYTGNYICRPN